MLDYIFVLDTERFKHWIIDDLCSVKVREKKPYKESWADPSPVWNEPENESKEGLNNIEDSKDHPVGEPNFVIIFIFGLDGSDGMKSWIEHSHACDQDSPSLDQEQNDEENTSNESQDCTWVQVSLCAHIY